MFKFKTPQKVFEVGGIKVGGQLGESLPVLIGTIFYHKHRIVDEVKGDFDRSGAEGLIKLQDEWSKKTKIPCLLDIVGASPEALTKRIDFVANVTDVPILIDAPSSDILINTLKHVSEVGLEDRVVYNSLHKESREEEFSAIKESGVESAVILAFKRGFVTSKGRVETVQQTLRRAEEAGVTKPLIDTCVLDIPSLAFASRAMFEIKSKLGLPCGMGAHNAMASWRGFKNMFGQEPYKTTLAVVNAFPVVLGADFLLYGPIEDCIHVFPGVYAVYSSYKYLARERELFEIQPVRALG